MNKKITRLVLAVGFMAFCSPAFAGELKIATVDMRKVFEDYHKTKEATLAISNDVAEMTKGLKEMDADFEKARDAYKAAYDRSNDQSISADERAKSKKDATDKAIEAQRLEGAMKDYQSNAEQKLADKKGERISGLVKEIRQVLNAMAASGGYDLVLDKSGETSPGVPVVIYAGTTNDLTDGLIQRLNAGALPMPVPDKKTPASK